MLNNIIISTVTGDTVICANDLHAALYTFKVDSLGKTATFDTYRPTWYGICALVRTA